MSSMGARDLEVVEEDRKLGSAWRVAKAGLDALQYLQLAYLRLRVPGGGVRREDLHRNIRRRVFRGVPDKQNGEISSNMWKIGL